MASYEVLGTVGGVSINDFTVINQAAQLTDRSVDELDKIIERFNKYNQSILVVSLAGKISNIADFQFDKIESDCRLRKAGFQGKQASGAVNFSGAVLFSRCKDKMFATKYSNINNPNIKNYLSDLKTELENCEDCDRMVELEQEIEDTNQYINSRKVDFSFGFIIDPNSITIQNAFPSQHNTINRLHDKIEIIEGKAYSSGITESDMFRDKHYQVNEKGVLIPRSKPQEDIEAVKKHIEKGRLADANHLNNPQVLYDKKLSEILFLPNADYRQSISAGYIDLASGFENCSKVDVNNYLSENSEQIIFFKNKMAEKPLCLIFNNESGGREIAKINFADGILSVVW